MSKLKQIVIFSDGACSGNPGPGGWGAILSSGDKPTSQVRELGGGDAKTTNNRMEITAAMEALRHIGIKISNPPPILLYTDSTYLIRGITNWVFAWERNGWLTSTGKPVENSDLWKALRSLIEKHAFKIEWRYVPGHSGSPGNERCDEIAVSFSKASPLSLFNGSYKNYGIPLYPLPPKVELPPMQSMPLKAKGNPIYLSYVNGQLYRDKDWKSCEARVKGVPGARYKKAESEEEANAVLRSWGIKP